MAIYSGFTHWKWWFSIVMLVYQRVSLFANLNVRRSLKLKDKLVLWYVSLLRHGVVRWIGGATTEDESQSTAARITRMTRSPQETTLDSRGPNLSNIYMYICINILYIYIFIRHIYMCIYYYIYISLSLSPQLVAYRCWIPWSLAKASTNIGVSPHFPAGNPPNLVLQTRLVP